MNTYTRGAAISLCLLALIVLMVVAGLLKAGLKPEWRVDIRSTPVPVVFNVPSGRTPVLVLHADNVRIEVKGRRVEVGPVN